MRVLKLLLGMAVVSVTFATAQAQTYSIGTNPQGSLFFATGTAISKVAVLKTGLQFRVAPYGGSSTYVPLINKGELEFGLANAGESHFAYTGTEIFDGKPNPNIRLVGVLYHINGTFAVATNSPIKSIKDLKGKRVPSDYTSGAVFRYITNSLLATEGLTIDSVKKFPVANFVQAVNSMASGKVDAAYIPLGSGIGKKAMASMKDGWRYITFDNNPGAAEAMAKVFPFGTPQVIKPGKRNTGVATPTSMFRVVAYLLAGAHVSNDVVYQLTKTIHTNKSDLAKAFGKFNAFKPDTMATKHSVPYHPGAIKYFTEIGQWPPK